MHRKSILQGLIKGLQDRPNITMLYEPDYNNANLTVRNNDARVALIEVAESGKNDIGNCLTICKYLRKDSPACKLLLMCSEQDKNCVKKVVDAKGNQQIDDFVFYDVTIDYLASKLISI